MTTGPPPPTRSISLWSLVADVPPAMKLKAFFTPSRIPVAALPPATVVERYTSLEPAKERYEPLRLPGIVR
ncbi:hypothetical protein BDFB_005684 [Asbolus verrucosus]|uniref:Uncharacterized protein n=1 Tax=Asbolus verrucosus TaxID=1661398 RepID=A0A482WC32_ASBVE|nr:hypothetical protein BDFB_005684 [Asbolus verrucosus]